MIQARLFDMTAADVHAIADRLNNSMISEIPGAYYQKYGAGWKLKLQGDIVATAVEWCHRDLTAIKHEMTVDEIVRIWYKYTYFDLFKEMGLPELRPKKALEEGLVRTYAYALLEG